MLRRRVLLVEDDRRADGLLPLHLEVFGYEVDHIADGRQALSRARDLPFDLILLDIAVPGLDGFTLCRAIRDAGANVETPIVIVTARDAEADKVLGLDSGADDYVTKPFGVRELVARVEAVMRRQTRGTARTRRTSAPVGSGDLELHCDRRQVLVR